MYNYPSLSLIGRKVFSMCRRWCNTPQKHSVHLSNDRCHLSSFFLDQKTVVRSFFNCTVRSLVIMERRVTFEFFRIRRNAFMYLVSQRSLVCANLKLVDWLCIWFFFALALFLRGSNMAFEICKPDRRIGILTVWKNVFVWFAIFILMYVCKRSELPYEWDSYYDKVLWLMSTWW